MREVAWEAEATADGGDGGRPDLGSRQRRRVPPGVPHRTLHGADRQPVDPASFRVGIGGAVHHHSWGATATPAGVDAHVHRPLWMRDQPPQRQRRHMAGDGLAPVQRRRQTDPPVVCDRRQREYPGLDPHEAARSHPALHGAAADLGEQLSPGGPAGFADQPSGVACHRVSLPVRAATTRRTAESVDSRRQCASMRYPDAESDTSAPTVDRASG